MLSALAPVTLGSFTGQRDLAPREETGGGPEAVPRPHGGVLPTAEEEGGDGVRHQRAGEGRMSERHSSGCTESDL